MPIEAFRHRPTPNTATKANRITADEAERIKNASEFLKLSHTETIMHGIGLIENEIK